MDDADIDTDIHTDLDANDEEFPQTGEESDFEYLDDNEICDKTIIGLFLLYNIVQFRCHGSGTTSKSNKYIAFDIPNSNFISENSKFQ